jgi:hypothetical protein
VLAGTDEKLMAKIGAGPRNLKKIAARVRQRYEMVSSTHR